jgi:hypothetical protein
MADLKSKLKELLDLEWSEEDKTQLETCVKNAMYYKAFMTKASEKDIIACLEICIREKKLLDILRKN